MFAVHAYGPGSFDTAKLEGYVVKAVAAGKLLKMEEWCFIPPSSHSNPRPTVQILLSVAAVISLALGLFQDFGPGRDPDEPAVEWVEGVAIMVAIVVVVLVGSLTDWQKERQFRVLNAKKDERTVKVIMLCDGVFLSGHNVRCDKSGATGESDVIKKMKYEDCLELRKTLDHDKKDASPHTDCFLISGSKILEGVGSYVVITVRPRSFHRRIMTSEGTALQRKLEHLANRIAVAGSLGGLMLFIGLLIRYFVKIGTDTPHMSPSQKGLAFVDILILSFTLVVASVPEGLPLAIALALALATKRMTRENLLVRVLNSCETMANTSVICTDKTGTLTQNAMTVVAGTIGGDLAFVRDLAQNPERATPDATPIELRCLSGALPPPLRALLNTPLRSTAPRSKMRTQTPASPWPGYKAVREAAEALQVFPFPSERKAMGVVVRLPGGRARLYVKGASEVLVAACARQVVVTERENVVTKVTDEDDRARILESITSYASQTLHTIAVCYRDLDDWSPKADEVSWTDLARDLTLAGLFALEDPLRPGVRKAVADCARAGVQVKMCTGDNVLTTRSIATQCGIFTPGGIVMEGPRFRALSDTERRVTVQRLQVLARSSPEDKRILVTTLKELGEIVAITGDGTNDGPALKAAHVGFSMGVTGTEVTKEASDIVLMDDNWDGLIVVVTPASRSLAPPLSTSPIFGEPAALDSPAS
ncbi:HAD-like domain-containing protein [Epithele typhae]|uniref:HAD-like domain-containing protein n=1 Tax=Epithele typhae TaxID=378194 RepID=UPI002008048F|nr:HAD-like domain-containing protein [Epithele typhae]KAH9910250.1 HAD-like domain-containing protein [Epithele typhae]